MKDFEIDFSEFGKRISLEIGIPIQLQLDGVSFPLQSILVGMEIENYLILKIPVQYANIKHKLVPGVEIIVRYIYQGIVFGFQAKLIEIVSRPVKLLFLEYPKIIEHHELRSQKRAQSILPAVITIKDNTCNGAIVDISINGCRCNVLATKHQPLPPAQIDDDVKIVCKFLGIQGDHQILGVIRNIKKSRKEMIIGVEFMALEQDIHNHISRYIYAVENFASSPLK